MATKQPRPRPCYSFGAGGATGHTAPDGTWLEAEEWCYPRGGMGRRAYVTCPDGRRRVVRCGLADTMSSIPARMRLGGRTVRGFVSSGESGFTFTPDRG